MNKRTFDKEKKLSHPMENTRILCSVYTEGI